MSVNETKLLNSISKMKTRSLIMKLKPEELLYVSQAFHDFITSKYPIQDFYRERLKEYDPIINKFGRCRTLKSARKLSHHVPLNVFQSICRWRLKFINYLEEERAAEQKMKSKIKKQEKPTTKVSTSNVDEPVDVKPSTTIISMSLLEPDDGMPGTSGLPHPIKQEIIVKSEFEDH